MPQQINLIDPTLLPAVQRLHPNTLLATLAVAAAVVLAHAAWEHVALAQALAAVAQDTQNAEQATGTVAVGSGDAAPGHARADQLARGEALRDMLRQQAVAPEGSARILAQIMQALPDTLWLTEIELGSARALRISGGTTDSASFGLFAQRLTTIEALTGLPISTVRLESQPPARAESSSDAQLQASVQQFMLASTPAALPNGQPAAPGAPGPGDRR